MVERRGWGSGRATVARSSRAVCKVETTPSSRRHVDTRSCGTNRAYTVKNFKLENASRPVHRNEVALVLEALDVNKRIQNRILAVASKVEEEWREQQVQIASKQTSQIVEFLDFPKFERGVKESLITRDDAIPFVFQTESYQRYIFSVRYTRDAASLRKYLALRNSRIQESEKAGAGMFVSLMNY